MMPSTSTNVSGAVIQPLAEQANSRESDFTQFSIAYEQH